jgi:hypothetical protein
VLLPPGFPSERNLNPLAEREEGGWEDKVLKFQSAIKAVFMTVKKGTGEGVAEKSCNCYHIL